jgi:hypothetical protein
VLFLEDCTDGVLVDFVEVGKIVQLRRYRIRVELVFVVLSLSQVLERIALVLLLSFAFCRHPLETVYCDSAFSHWLSLDVRGLLNQRSAFLDGREV